MELSRATSAAGDYKTVLLPMKKSVDADQIRTRALSLKNVKESPHRKDIIAFKISGKIFATVNPTMQRACLRLSEVDQQLFSSIPKCNIHPVPNAWGRYGWTLFYFKNTDEETMRDALLRAYLFCAPAGRVAEIAREYESK